QFYQEQFPVRGFQSSSDPVALFGISGNTSIDSLIVIWPDNSYQEISKVKANQSLTVKYHDAKRKWSYDTIQSSKESFLSQALLEKVWHQENDYNDFTSQSLLPNYLS